MRLKIILPVIICLFSVVVHSQMQRDSLLFRGVIMEGDSLYALPYARYIVNNNAKYTANESGQFSFWAKNGDIVNFSYVGFKPFYVQIHDSLSSENYLMGVFLSRDTIELSEVIILPQNINPSIIARNMPMLSTSDDIAAQNNIAMSTYQAKTQPIKEWDAEMNQKNFIQARSMDIQYKTQVKPSQMIGLSNTAINKEIERSRLKRANEPRRMYISQIEWEYLIASYEQKLKKKFGE